jgi:anti-sigma-K factor RskA
MSDPDDRDLLAAEYVLGTLDAAEREAVVSRLAADAELAGGVLAWQELLAPLSEATREVVPPAAVFESLVARLFRTRTAANDDTVLHLERRLRRWRRISAGFATLAASLLAWILVQERVGRPPQARFTAVLQRDAGSPAMVLDVDLATRRLTVRPVAAASPAGKSYELWMIDPAIGAPRSLGLVPAVSGSEASLTAYDPAVITGATYAVTVEPPGGSPDGRPSTTPVLTGRLVPAAP